MFTISTKNLHLYRHTNKKIREIFVFQIQTYKNIIFESILQDDLFVSSCKKNWTMFSIGLYIIVEVGDHL